MRVREFLVAESLSIYVVCHRKAMLVHCFLAGCLGVLWFCFGTLCGNILKSKIADHGGGGGGGGT